MAHSHRHHVLLFPFLAKGHLIPFVALARLLELKTNYAVTIITTPFNIPTIQSSLPPTSTIRIASLPFNGSDHGLPPNVENTNALPFHLVINLLQALETLQPSLERFISDIHREDGHPPLCIISDIFMGWTVQIANKLDVFHAVFISCGAYGGAALCSLWLNLPHCRIDSDEFQIPDFPEAGYIDRSQLSYHLRIADRTDSYSLFLQRQLSLTLRSDGFLFNTVEDLETAGLGYFSRKTNRPVWPVGPIASFLRNRECDSNEDGVISTNNCIEWLNLHHPSSVLYVCFGSQNTISASQMMQLAVGLEASGQNFIWVVRPPLGFDVNGDFRVEWLPEGFEDRITERNQGILVQKWAPQTEILSHGSTGAFLSHCGWNSVVESLSRGVPLIGWPLSGEQFYNSKMMEEELGVCAEVARGFDSEVSGENVKRVIEMVMGGSDRGEEMRRKALGVREIMEEAVREDEGFKGSSVKMIEEFISTLSSMKKTVP
ncbi:UDP-glycosyltransferase 92A1-like [Magnolia sinica]|uniref:UDP-glycosyltransferase 92A1-like n=1 Tax=Magnolia sinica TaxID=86752 RepID=UPI00265B23B6|nr:UDP-glycosyltransferase 92A1-like [Magnolia sinica]